MDAPASLLANGETVLANGETVPNEGRTVPGEPQVVDLKAVTARVEFDDFYRANIDNVASALGATLHDADLGREAAGEAMVRALERWSKVRVHANPAGWCYRVGLNWATSRWRKRRRETTSDPVALQLVAAPPTTHINHALHEAVRQLPIPQRSVVVLTYWMGWSRADIAAALNIAEGTVGSRLNRSLQQLRTHAKDAQ